MAQSSGIEFIPEAIQSLVKDFPGIELLKLHPLPHVITYHRRFVYTNPAAIKLYDALAEGDLLGKDITVLMHPLDHGRLLNRLEILSPNHLANQPTFTRIKTLTGKTKKLITTSQIIEFKGISFVMASGTELSSGITRREMEADLHFQTLFENMHDVIFRMDREQTITMIGPSVEKVLGFMPEEIIGKNAMDFFGSSEKYNEMIRVLHLNGEIVNCHFPVRNKIGEMIDLEISGKIVKNLEEKHIGIDGIFRDITNELKIKTELKKLATYDELTSALNRRSFILAVERVVKDLRRNNASCIISIIDLDKFKVINDENGHLFGDKILKKFSQVLHGNLRESDIFGRLGGDEFGVVFVNCNESESGNIFDRIILQLSQAMVRLPRGGFANISASFGCTQLTGEDIPVSLALARADGALYQAKKDGGCCYRFAGGNECVV